MPTELHFRRDHFAAPRVDHAAWRLELVGLDASRRSLSLAALRRLPRSSLAVVLQCAGFRRSEFEPPAPGVPWGPGAVSEAVWSGARLADVLALLDAGAATHVVLEGADRGLVPEHGSPTTFGRAIPLDKALDPDTLLAWEMNGHPLPHAHGAPLRAIVPGWYATDSVKWLAKVRLHAGPYDGYFDAVDYRVPDESGGTRRLTALPVNSFLTSHEDGAVVPAGAVDLRGIAWGTRAAVAAVEVAIDDDEWLPATLTRPAGPYARVHWHVRWHAEPGRHTLRVRAADTSGLAQPDALSWNPGGFANSSIQRLAITVSPHGRARRAGERVGGASPGPSAAG
jgi:DMSO/TMAO reductase YedYZ molybdopterin-dependent catalytic subunit